MHLWSKLHVRGNIPLTHLFISRATKVGALGEGTISERCGWSGGCVPTVATASDSTTTTTVRAQASRALTDHTTRTRDLSTHKGEQVLHKYPPLGPLDQKWRLLCWRVQLARRAGVNVVDYGLFFSFRA